MDKIVISGGKKKAIVRRFLLERIPAEIAKGIVEGMTFSSIVVRKGYILDDQESCLREEVFHELRHLWGKTFFAKSVTYFLKSSENDKHKRAEIEIFYPNHFFLRWESIKYQLCKVQFVIPFERNVFELNVFLGKFNGYMNIKVGFENKESAKAFTSPDWFGREITHDSSHSDFALVSTGLPKAYNEIFLFGCGKPT